MAAAHEACGEQGEVGEEAWARELQVPFLTVLLKELSVGMQSDPASSFLRRSHSASLMQRIKREWGVGQGWGGPARLGLKPPQALWGFLPTSGGEHFVCTAFCLLHSVVQGHG